jgi:hypothetical protein
MQTHLEHRGLLYRVRAHLDFNAASIAIHPFEIASHRKAHATASFEWRAAFRACTLFPDMPPADFSEAERCLQLWAAHVIATSEQRSITDEDFAPELKRWRAGDER